VALGEPDRLGRIERGIRKRQGEGAIQGQAFAGGERDRIQRLGAQPLDRVAVDAIDPCQGLPNRCRAAC
jgi:hypothetical protein